MSWQDRISRAVAEWPQPPLVSGQWRYIGRNTVPIRGAIASQGDILLAAGDGAYHLSEPIDQPPDPWLIPDEDARRVLRMMGESIENRCLGHGWLEWLAEPPLMPPVDDVLDETELEQFLTKKLGHLEAVCRRPRMHLKLEEERQLVSRCRRPSMRAAQVLASHSEDWERKTLWGVRPKRILGLVRDDLYDLYENRLAVVLVGRLDEALAQRIREVRRIVLAARSMNEWSKTLEDGSNHWRAERVCNLWGDLWKDKGLLERAEEALTRLMRLRQRVLGLRDTILYKKIGGRHRNVQLRMTNVLTHDDLYRGVVELWKAWERHVLPGDDSPQTLWDREQKAARGMSLFAVLVLVHALDALRIEPAEGFEDKPLMPGASIRLTGTCGPLDLIWSNDDGPLVLQPRHGEALRLLELPAMLEASLATERWLEALEEEGLLMLHLCSDQPRAPEQVRVKLHGPGPMQRPAVLCSVAPWELESVERVARALRWQIWGGLYRSFPQQIDFPKRSWRPPETLPAWVRQKDGSLHVLAPPRNGTAWPELERRRNRAAREAQRVQQRIDSLDPRKKEDRKHLRKQLADFQNALQLDEQVCSKLSEAAAWTRSLLACPTCPGTATPYEFEAIGGQFRVTCPSCGTTWGLRDCAHCDQPFPFIAFPDNEPGAAPLEVDHRYGCDVLAFPVTEEAYLCTRCGQRSDGAPP